MWSNDIAGAAVGDEYRYVLQYVSDVLTRRDPHSRLVTDSDYATGNSIIYDRQAFDWGAQSFTPPALEDLVIYEMHIGSFYDQPGGLPGTFAEAIQQLPYLADLGVTAIEVLPVAEFPTRFSGGYNPSDIFAVENLGYGGPDGFKSFIKAAHEQNLAVLLDVVYNHWGPWDLAVHRFDGWWNSNWNGGIYFYDSTRINSPWGPRPNYSSQEVRDFIFDNLRMWVEEYRVDGFRLDATSNIYNTDGGNGIDLPDGWSLLQTYNRGLKKFFPDKISIAEDLTHDSSVTSAVAGGGLGFDSQWHFFASTLRQQLSLPDDQSRNIGSVRWAVTSLFNNAPLQRVIYTESHNEICCGAQRLTRMIDSQNPNSWNARKRSTLGAAVLFTSPGIPMIYQGQEFLDQNTFDPQLPLDWNQLTLHPGIHLLYKDLIGLRLNRSGKTKGLKKGQINVHNSNDVKKLLGFHRWELGGPGDDVIVLANFSSSTYIDHELGFPAPGTWHVRFNSDSTFYSGDFGNAGSAIVQANGPAKHGMPQSGKVTIGPYSALIMSQN